MKYVAIISSAHKRVVDPFIQETYEKFKQFRIQLQYKDEFFIMDCLKNISIIN